MADLVAGCDPKWITPIGLISSPGEAARLSPSGGVGNDKRFNAGFRGLASVSTPLDGRERPMNNGRIPGPSSALRTQDRLGALSKPYAEPKPILSAAKGRISPPRGAAATIGTGSGVVSTAVFRGHRFVLDLRTVP